MFYSLTQSLRDLSQTVRDLQREMQLQVCTETRKRHVQYLPLVTAVIDHKELELEKPCELHAF